MPTQTHQLVAEEPGSSREVISRLLKDLERSGLIDLSRGSITIRDKRGVKALVDKP